MNPNTIERWYKLPIQTSYLRIYNAMNTHGLIVANLIVHTTFLIHSIVVAPSCVYYYDEKGNDMYYSLLTFKQCI